MLLTTMQAVCAELRLRAVPATLEYPGFIKVEVAATGVEFNWGDSDDTFAADVYYPPIDPAAKPDEVIETTLPSDSADVQRIADIIACHFTEACSLAPEYQSPEEFAAADRRKRDGGR